MSVCTLVNVVFSWVPRLLMAVIAATAIRAAMRPYSMAVAPCGWSVQIAPADPDELGVK